MPSTGPHLSFAAVLQQAYSEKGANPGEAAHILAGIAPQTLRRYEHAWGVFQDKMGSDILQVIHDLSAAGHVQHLAPSAALALQVLQAVPIWRLSLWVQKFTSLTSPAQGKNLYAALVLLPPCQMIRFETLLKKTKKSWNSSKPKYSVFFDVEPLLTKFAAAPMPVTEADIRLRLILLLRLLCLFRGVDLERSKRTTIQFRRDPWFLEAKRKGRSYYMHYPVPKLDPPPCDPQELLQRYILCTAWYPGEELLLTLPNSLGVRTPLKSDTINSLTTGYLRGEGITDYTAHSTRGAAATSLLKRGVSPHLVQQMGDWQSYDCFMKFYNRWQATGVSLQVLLQPLPP